MSALQFARDIFKGYLMASFGKSGRKEKMPDVVVQARAQMKRDRKNAKRMRDFIRCDGCGCLHWPK